MCTCFAGFSWTMDGTGFRVWRLTRPNTYALANAGCCCCSKALWCVRSAPMAAELNHILLKKNTLFWTNQALAAAIELPEPEYTRWQTRANNSPRVQRKQRNKQLPVINQWRYFSQRGFCLCLSVAPGVAQRAPKSFRYSGSDQCCSRWLDLNQSRKIKEYFM